MLRLEGWDWVLLGLATYIAVLAFARIVLAQMHAHAAQRSGKRIATPAGRATAPVVRKWAA